MPDFDHEHALTQAGFLRIAGVDEAGRGPWAGSVVAAAVVLPTDFSLLGLHDSKKLSPAKRGRLEVALKSDSRVDWALGRASVEEIDELNILRATWVAMKRAVLGLREASDHALVDGKVIEGLPIPHRALVKGDSLSLSIAAASILAKEERDREMLELDGQFPGYGFAQHKGYGTKQHQEALADLGPCAAHRRSFAPVRRALMGQG